MGRPTSTPAPGASRAPGTCGRTGLLVVFAVAVLAQSWIVALPFQYDDYALLVDPLSLFARVPAQLASGEHDAAPFMLRWTLWLFWGVCASFSGATLSPVPFHVAALVLHGVVSVLLARLVARLVPRDVARPAGVLSGVLFGASAGGIAAVSWTAAQSDLLFPFFGLVAANALLDARERAGRARAVRRAVALVALWLALVTKAPAFLVPPALAVLVWVARRSSGARRELLPRPVRVEWTLLAASLALGFLSRYLYLGSFRLQYQTVSVPGLADLPSTVWRALAALGQALYPWNRHPVFAGDGPLIAERVFGSSSLAPAALAGALFGALGVVALVRAPKVRGAIGVAVLLALVGALPTGLLYAGQPTNVVGRTTYFPLLFALPALALALAGLLERHRPTGVACAAILAVLVVDTTVHVARTEFFAANHQAAARNELERLRIEHHLAGASGDLVVIAVVPDDSVGGIPALGFRIADAFRPPFIEPPGLDVRAVDTPGEALELLTDGDVPRAADLAVVGREWNAEPATRVPGQTHGAAERERLRLRAWAPLRTGRASRPEWRRRSDLDPNVLVATEPIPAHALAVFWVGFEAGDAARGELVLERTTGDEVVVPLELATSDVLRRVPVAPWRTFDEAFGAPIDGVRWHSPDVSLLAAPEPLERLPELESLAPPGGAELDPGPTPPPFEVRPPPGWCLPSATLLELRQLLPRGPLPVFVGEPSALPWADFASALVAAARSKPRYRGEFDWRLTRTHPSGHLAARSPFRTAHVSLKPAP